MILPDGYSDVPAGKIAAVVTHLEMTERPVLPPDPAGAWKLRKVDTPGLDWFRDLYRRVGEEWLWFSRLQMTDAELAAVIQSPPVEVHALAQDGHDEGLLELDFRQSGQCQIASDNQGRGAGGFALDFVARLARARGLDRIRLRAFVGSPAIRLYQRAGFRAFRRQIEVADDPRLDGTAPRHVARHVPVIE